VLEHRNSWLSESVRWPTTPHYFITFYNRTTQKNTVVYQGSLQYYYCSIEYVRPRENILVLCVAKSQRNMMVKRRFRVTMQSLALKMPDQCPEPKTGEIVLRGERHSGTNWIRKIMWQNIQGESMKIYMDSEIWLEAWVSASQGMGQALISERSPR